MICAARLAVLALAASAAVTRLFCAAPSVPSLRIRCREPAGQHAAAEPAAADVVGETDQAVNAWFNGNEANGIGAFADRSTTQ
jgi:hypothetical protein